jgi:methyl-accepting chemotaxis protein
VLQGEIQEVDQEIQSVVRAISKQLISDDEAGQTMKGLRERKEHIGEELGRIEPQLVNVPTENQIKNRAALIKKTIGEIFSSSQHLKKMTNEQKKTFVRTFFAGKDPEGRRYGV